MGVRGLFLLFSPLFNHRKHAGVISTAAVQRTFNPLRMVRFHHDPLDLKPFYLLVLEKVGENNMIETIVGITDETVNKKILAIKALRETTSMGLKEAKDKFFDVLNGAYQQVDVDEKQKTILIEAGFIFSHRSAQGVEEPKTRIQIESASSHPDFRKAQIKILSEIVSRSAFSFESDYCEFFSACYDEPYQVEVTGQQIQELVRAGISIQVVAPQWPFGISVEIDSWEVVISSRDGQRIAMCPNETRTLAQYLLDKIPEKN